MSGSLPASMSISLSASIGALLAGFPAAALAEPATAGWKDGFFLQSEDGAHKLRLGAIAQFDGRAFLSDEDDAKTDQFSFRSLRPELSGTLFDVFDFRLLPDFAGSRVVVQDAYVDLRVCEALRLRFGKFKVPFGLERLQAETATLFAERGLPTQLAPNRDLGVQLFGELGAGAVSYQLGVFNGVADGQSGDGDSSDDKELAARVSVKPLAAVAPILAELGVALAVTYGDKQGTLVAPDVAGLRTSGQTAFFSYRAGAALADTVVADGAHLRATAAASYFAGPVGGLAEYVRSQQTVLLAGDHARLDADAWQLAVQLVLTGEKATWKSVTPAAPFAPEQRQWGAFDVVARVGGLRQIDGAAFEQGFADPTRAARRATSVGGGVDWFPNKNVRFALNAERTWFRLGAKDAAGAAADRAPEITLVGRVQAAF